MGATQRSGTGRSSQFSYPTYGFPLSGTLSLVDLLIIPGKGFPVSRATAQVAVAPVGADITVDILLIERADGSTVSTLGTVTIPAGSLQSNDLVFASTNVPTARALKGVVTQVGSTGTEGSDLVMLVS